MLMTAPVSQLSLSCIKGAVEGMRSRFQFRLPPPLLRLLSPSQYHRRVTLGPLYGEVFAMVEGGG